jgi:hypothetical protein
MILKMWISEGELIKPESGDWILIQGGCSRKRWQVSQPPGGIIHY